MIKPTLLVLAAGMGSRYGSLKQMDGVGPGNEAIIDYSVYDAIRAGFPELTSLQYVINLNPIYWYITAVRSCVMWGEGLTPNMVLIPFLCAALSLGLGIWVFKKNQDKFVLYM